LLLSCLNLRGASAEPTVAKSDKVAIAAKAADSEKIDVSTKVDGRATWTLSADDELFLDDLQHRTFRYFWETTNPTNGLVFDRWPSQSPSSIAAVGFGLTAYGIGVERGWVSREEAVERTLATLRFFSHAPQSESPDASGYRGLFYHFLDMKTGQRWRTCELSSIDTALLMAGVLFCQSYFDADNPQEAEIRRLADGLYRTAEWDFMQPRPPLVAMGWKPESGFGQSDYKGYCEAMLLYVLALGSRTHPIDEAAWSEMTSTYIWGDFYGYPHVNFGPLFGHQYSHAWIDFRNLQDGYMREREIDYFENSRRATQSQRAYATENPAGWTGYGPQVWGLTACDGPGRHQLEIGGTQRQFYSYFARGASLETLRDDGTIAPTAVGGSLPFAPDITIPALREMRDTYGEHLYGKFGFLDSFNPSFSFEDAKLRHGKVIDGKLWVNSDYLGIDQGPILIMAENLRSEFVWQVMRRSPYIKRGLKRAKFEGGWLDAVQQVSE